jgi:CO/xanthine dehydrogenase FAD-binding subunit
MPALKEFHKPTDIPAALALLKRKSPRTIPLAGGTWLNPRIDKEGLAEAVVDLSGLGLDRIERDADALLLGAMATLAAVTEDESCRSLADGILAQTARRDAVLNVRNAATVGGTVVVAPSDSEFILALLALNAQVSVQSKELDTWPLSQFLTDPAAALDYHQGSSTLDYHQGSSTLDYHQGSSTLDDNQGSSTLDGGLVTQVQISLPLPAAAGLARVAYTLSDHPIVAAVAVVIEDSSRIALGGVAARPLVVELDTGSGSEAAQDAVAQAIAEAEQYADFRGSADYRRAMGILMAKRALQRASGRVQ